MAVTRHVVAGAALLAMVVVAHTPGSQATIRAPRNPINQNAAGSCVVGRVVDGVTGQAIEGAVVTLASGGSAADRVLTNSTGAFLAWGASSEFHEISALFPGYTNRREAPASSGVEVVATKTNACVSAPLIRLWPLGAIAGTIVDERARALLGIRVRAFRRTTVAGVSRLTETGYAESDDRGRFLIEGLMPGSYVVGYTPVHTTTSFDVADAVAKADLRVPWLSELLSIGEAPTRASGFHVDGHLLGVGREVVVPSIEGDRMLVSEAAFTPDSPEGAATSVIVVSGSTFSAGDLRVRASPARRVVGRLSADGVPVPHTALWLIRTLVGDSHADIPVASGFSDERGNFRLIGVPPGRYELRINKGLRAVRRSGEATSPLTGVGATPASTDRPLWASVPIDVSSSDMTDVEVALSPTSTISGRAVLAGNSGTDPTRTDRLTVGVELANGRGLPSGIGQARAAADGTFALTGLPAGKYVFRVIASSSAELHISSVAAGARTLPDAHVDLDGDLTDAVLTLNDSATRVTGTVSIKSGVPPREVVLLLFPSLRSTWIEGPVSRRRFRAVGLDASGGFSLTGVPAGNYYAVAVRGDSTDEWQRTERLSVLARAAAQLEVIDGRTATLVAPFAEVAAR